MLGRLTRMNGPAASTVAPAPVISPAQAGVPEARLAMPAPFADLDAPPVFITGHARSGTSWTLDLFDRHPEVCAIFETWLLTQTHGVTSVLSQPQWNPEFYEAQRAKLGLPQAVVQLLPYEEMLRELGELVAAWLMRPVGPEHRFLVEKSPLDIDATAALFPEARFVHVVRDGRDVALSMNAAAGSWDPGMGRGVSMGSRAHHWRSAVEEIRSHRERLGSRYLELRFEDLRNDFDVQVTRLFEFCGIPLDDGTRDRIRRETELSSYSPEVRASGFRGAGRAGGWRRRLSVADAIRFDRAAGALLVDLGYADDRLWWREVVRGRLSRASRS